MASRLGATLLTEDTATFEVWAPFRDRVEVVLEGGARIVPLGRGEDGIWTGEVSGVVHGSKYMFRLDGRITLPDPASRRQCDGVHGPSSVVCREYPWAHEHPGLHLPEAVFYEMHIGTFTPQGDLTAASSKLPHLKRLGITAVELMPVASFPGLRNWGYDGVYLYSVHESYGGPDALKGFVDACHREGLSVILDVVYNHLGPEGNYLHEYGPYFSKFFRTPWGDGFNFDSAHSDQVRRFIIQNALEWVRDYRIDGLRLDAVDLILDRSPMHILEELSQAVRRLETEEDRRIVLIAESDQNDPRYVRRTGYGLDAMWAEDLHHALHAFLTDETAGYYADFGTLEDVRKAWERGAAYEGSRSRFRNRRHGRALDGIEASQLVVYSQNHDQIGNRPDGARLPSLIGFERHRVALAVVLLSPWVPLLFMGEEYGETKPFYFFVDYGDADLRSAVKRGRERQVRTFGWKNDPPDPSGVEVFRASILDPEALPEATRIENEEYVRALLELRARLAKGSASGTVFEESVFRMEWPGWVAVASFSDRGQTVELPPGEWHVVLSSEAACDPEGGTTVHSGTFAIPGVGLWVLGPKSSGLGAADEPVVVETLGSAPFRGP
ncbi:MAG: malto-oligosyltrehalose trehalohydrolase [Myxococcota bacterium]